MSIYTLIDGTSLYFGEQGYPRYWAARSVPLRSRRSYAKWNELVSGLFWVKGVRESAPQVIKSATVVRLVGFALKCVAPPLA